MPTIADRKDFLHALHGVDFPASRSRVLAAARDTGGLNGDVLLILEQIPDRTYESPEDLTEEIQRTNTTSIEGDVQSASASAVSEQEKDLISAMADPRRGDFGPGESNGKRKSGQDQAQRILKRNRDLVDGKVEPTSAGEAETGVGRMVNSDRSHVGDSTGND